MSKRLLKAYKEDKLLFNEVENANHFGTRFMGLMFRKSIDDDHALLLTPCSEIHTFFMKFDIDTVAMDKNNKVLFIDEAVPPAKMRKRVKHTYKILEMNSGVATRLGIKVGDTLIFK